MFQKFINIKNEYRVLVIGGKAVSAHTKIARDYGAEKVCYFDPTAKYVFVDLQSLPKKIIAEAQKAAKVLSLDIAGVDVCRDGKGIVHVFEVNRDPGIDSRLDSPEILGLVKYFARAIT